MLAVGADATENEIGAEVGEFNAVGLKGEAKALALLVQHPEWSNKQIAAEVGCSRTSLYRRARYRQARRAMGGTLPKGSKSAEGDLEAYED